MPTQPSRRAEAAAWQSAGSAVGCAVYVPWCRSWQPWCRSSGKWAAPRLLRHRMNHVAWRPPISGGSDARTPSVYASLRESGVREFPRGPRRCWTRDALFAWQSAGSAVGCAVYVPWCRSWQPWCRSSGKWAAPRLLRHRMNHVAWRPPISGGSDARTPSVYASLRESGVREFPRGPRRCWTRDALFAWQSAGSAVGCAVYVPWCRSWQPWCRSSEKWAAPRLLQSRLHQVAWRPPVSAQYPQVRAFWSRKIQRDSNFANSRRGMSLPYSSVVRTIRVGLSGIERAGVSRGPNPRRRAP